jgi:hypothetical protein
MLPADVMRSRLIFDMGPGCFRIDTVNSSKCYHETAKAPTGIGAFAKPLVSQSGYYRIEGESANHN